MMIDQLPLTERPRERLLSHGAEGLSLAELLAVILGAGTRGKSVLSLAAELIERFGSPQTLMRASVGELMQIEGIGPAKALQLKAAFAFSLRALTYQGSEKREIASPQEAYHLVRPMLFGKKSEELYILLRDAKGAMLSIEPVHRGTLTQMVSHPRDLFSRAIERNAYSLIVAHNHPSGDCRPSEADYQFTQRIAAAGRLLHIPLDDHLIVNDNQFLSFYNEGYLEPRQIY